MAHGAPDFTKVMRGETDEVWIKGVAFRDPSVAACKPVSVESPALAYDLATDRFKVKLEAIASGVTQETDPRLYDLFAMLQRCDKYDFDYDAQERLQYLKVYDGVTLKMTLTFAYDVEGRLDTITRS